MCGIAGIINTGEAQPAHVQGMIDSIRYRGPNEMGIKALGQTIIGHARLTVVDPENGKQPMCNEDGTVWVVFNGGIYNHIELRAELEAKGHRFRSRCDTEVLLHLWQEEGENMLIRLIGMFAFFIWDTKQNRGILARDRQGIKPCFIAEYKGGYAFASEMKAILSLPDMKREINHAGVKDVFFFNYCPPPQTCFRGINHVEPGTYLLFEGNQKPLKKRYWHWPFQEDKITPSFEAFEALLDDSVRIQKRIDVTSGMYLSGGVDSSVIAYHLRKQSQNEQLEAFGLNFPVEGFSEFPFSQEVATLLDIDLYEARILPEMIPEIAGNVVKHAEQPHGDFSFFLFYILARQAHHGKKVVLFSGDGPDETLAGQHFHTQPAPDFTITDYFNTICYMSAQERHLLLNPDFERSTPEPWDRFQEIIAPYRDLDLVHQIVAYENNSLLPGNNLVKGDRMGAAWSTEGRAPLMDHRISELFIRLPADQKFRNGHSKYYFKEYAATKLPRDLIFKKKTMPTLPIGEWIKSVLHDWAHDTLARHDGSIINTKEALVLLAEHTSGVKNHTRPLRTMLMTQLWIENCVNSYEKPNLQ